MDGLQRMLEFLGDLKRKGIDFRIERQMPESLMVTFVRNGVCIEVDFFVDEVWFSYFRELKVAKPDEVELMAMLAAERDD